MMIELAGLSAVVTGASSGVGRATALALAAGGARVTLAARGREALEAAASDCTAFGSPAIAVPTDVTEFDGVSNLARVAVDTFGRLDVWINAVGVGAFGRFEETPMAAHRKVIETNLLGPINGAYAALPHFRSQGRGILINVNSLGAWVPSPYAAAYAAGKWGLLGFTKSLRAELLDFPEIAVCDVFPSFLNTPGLEHGANYSGHELSAPPPVYEPETVADAIIGLIHNPRPEVAVGLPAKAAHVVGTFAPGLAGAVASRVIGSYLGRAEPAPITDGNLYESAGPANRLRGIQGEQNTKLVGAMVAVAGVAVLAAGTAYFVRQRVSAEQQIGYH